MYILCLYILLYTMPFVRCMIPWYSLNTYRWWGCEWCEWAEVGEPGKGMFILTVTQRSIWSIAIAAIAVYPTFTQQSPIPNITIKLLKILPKYAFFMVLLLSLPHFFFLGFQKSAGRFVIHGTWIPRHLNSSQTPGKMHSLRYVFRPREIRKSWGPPLKKGAPCLTWTQGTQGF